LASLFLSACSASSIFCSSAFLSSPFGIRLQADFKRSSADFPAVTHAPTSVTKSEDWSYEAEWRLIAEERAFALAPLPDDALRTDDDFLTLPAGVLKSVTIGCLADASSHRLIEFVKTHATDVLVRQATLASDRYELRITPPLQ
jgi:hypothetical protein